MATQEHAFGGILSCTNMEWQRRGIAITLAQVRQRLDRMSWVVGREDVTRGELDRIDAALAAFSAVE